MTTPAQREQARLRQQRRRERLRQERGELAQRHCLSCLHPFQPKRVDSWLCSRRCIDRLSWHRKQATKAELSCILRKLRRALLAKRQGVSVEVVEQAFAERQPWQLQDISDLQRWWTSDQCKDRSDAVSFYWLWFPDLCGISPEEAEVDRLQWQRVVAQAWEAMK